MYYDYYHYYNPYHYYRNYYHPYYPYYPSYWNSIYQDIYNTGYMNDVWQYASINNWNNKPKATSKKTNKRK